MALEKPDTEAELVPVIVDDFIGLGDELREATRLPVTKPLALERLEEEVVIDPAPLIVSEPDVVNVPESIAVPVDDTLLVTVAVVD